MVMPWAVVSKSRWRVTSVSPSRTRTRLPEARVGLLPCAGGTQRLAQLVGEGWAKRMILCGERVSAEKARTLGLVEEVVEPGASLATAIDLAKRASDQSPTSIAACKGLFIPRETLRLALDW